MCLSSGDDFLIRLRDQVKEAIVQVASVPHKDIDQVATVATRDILLTIFHRWGGQQLYIPLQSRLFYATIYEAYTGDNALELSQRFRMAHGRIYRIIKSEQKRRAKEKGQAPSLQKEEQRRLPGC